MTPFDFLMGATICDSDGEEMCRVTAVYYSPNGVVLFTDFDDYEEDDPDPGEEEEPDEDLEEDLDDLEETGNVVPLQAVGGRR